MTGADRSSYGLPAAIEPFAAARTDHAVLAVGPDHRVAYWDARTELLTGLGESDAVGRPFHEALSGEREDGTPLCRQDCPALRLARAGQPVPAYEARLYSPSGKEHWVSVTVLAVESEEGPYLVKLLRDSHREHETLQMVRGLVRLSERGVSTASRQTPELTPRQLEVLGLLSEGKSARAIGSQLRLAETTVRGHIQALLQAFGAGSQMEAVARARDAGLLKG